MVSRPLAGAELRGKYPKVLLNSLGWLVVGMGWSSPPVNLLERVLSRGAGKPAHEIGGFPVWPPPAVSMELPPFPKRYGVGL